MTDPCARARELLAAATPGPWFYNSYSAVISQPRSEEYDAAVQALSDDSPAELWDALPEPYVAIVPRAVPRVGGDTATAQGSRDAALIAAAPELLSALLAEVDRLMATFTGYNATGHVRALEDNAALRAQIAKLREALRPFAEARRDGIAHGAELRFSGTSGWYALIDACDAALAALAESEETP